MVSPQIEKRIVSPQIEPRALYTETAVLAVHNSIVRTMDSGKLCDLMLLDLSAAFDTVDHPIRLLVRKFGPPLYEILNTPLDIVHVVYRLRFQYFMFVGRLLVCLTSARFTDGKYQCTDVPSQPAIYQLQLVLYQFLVTGERRHIHTLSTAVRKSYETL